MTLKQLGENIKGWIKNNKFLYLTFLFFVGITVGFSYTYVLGGTIRQAILLSTIFGLIFIMVDLTSWGWEDD